MLVLETIVRLETRENIVSITKVPAAQLNYSFNWAEWLDGDTISVSTWIVPEGLNKVVDSIVGAGTKTQIKLSGGMVGKTYTLTNRITTAVTIESEERSFQIQIVERKQE